MGHAGFKIYTWIPLDEDEDVSDEKLQEERDWWSLPGAPERPQVREQMRIQSVVPELPVVEEKDADLMEVDGPAKDANEINAETDIPVTAKEESVTGPAAVSPVALNVPALAALPVDTEMTDALSPVQSDQVPAPSPSSLLPSAPETHPKSPSPFHPPPTDPLESAKSPSKSPIPHPKEPTTMEDIFPSSKPSPPSDPLAQAKEVAVGLAIETPMERAEHAHDAGAISGLGGGIAGEGIVGAGAEDLRDEEGEVEKGTEEMRTEEETILEETKTDKDIEIVMDTAQE